MAYIGKKPEDKFRGLASYDTFTGDGSTTTFDVTNVLPDGGTYDVEVFVDNVRQEGGSGKSYTIGNDDAGDLKRITFAVAPDNAAEIYVINPGRNTAILQVSDNTVTAAKLQTDAVTTAKIQDDAVTNAKIGPAAVGATEISPGSITTTQISPSAAITNSQLANSSITINGNAVSLGGSITAGTDWQAVTVADGSTTLNAVAGKGYFLDTNAGVIEVFLPTSPTRGDTVILADYSGTFATNKCIVNTGGALIDSTQGGPAGGGNDFEITTNNAIVELVYVDAAKGWLVKYNTAPSALSTITGSGGGYDTPQYIVATGGTVTTTGDYKTHVFTGDGCFVVSTGAGSLATVDYMIVAGGGASGGRYFTGGGGAGGFRLSNSWGLPAPTTSPLASSCGVTVTTQTYPITVGGGGAGVSAPAPGANGNPGSNSVFSTITSAGGGGGAHNDEGPTGENGGSGGGGASPGSSGGGTGNTPPVSPPQGQDGGTGAPASPFGAGGGGGAGATGSSWNSPTPSVGGIGSFIDDTFVGPTAPSYGETGPVGSTRYFAGGGAGGAGCAPGPTTISGGIGGGGDGKGNATTGTAGVANTGGGGGGTGNNVPSPGGSAAGGKGIVILRYKFQN